MDATAEIGRNPVSKGTRFRLTVENEQADAGWDGQTRLARPNSQARTERGERSFFPSQLTTRRIDNHNRLIKILSNILRAVTFLACTEYKGVCLPSILPMQIDRRSSCC